MNNTMTPTHRKPGTLEQYNDIPISCSPGLHKFATELLLRHVKSKIVYEIGAGYGALTNRLIDVGFETHPFDFDTNDWKGRVPVNFIDANKIDESTLPKILSNVVSLELIEHLKSPFDFIDSIMNRLAPNGVFVFSTPNTRSPVSLLHFFLRRELFSFNRAMFWESGHISPIFDFIIEEYFKSRGWQYEKYAAGRVITGSFFKDLLIRFFSRLFFQATQKSDQYLHIADEGLCLVYVLKKTNQ